MKIRGFKRPGEDRRRRSGSLPAGFVASSYSFLAVQECLSAPPPRRLGYSDMKRCTKCCPPFVKEVPSQISRRRSLKQKLPICRARLRQAPGRALKTDCPEIKGAAETLHVGMGESSESSSTVGKSVPPTGRCVNPRQEES